MKLLYRNLKPVVTPRSSPVTPTDLRSDSALGVLGYFAEGLLLNESIIIPIDGPAIEIVALVRWLGEKQFEELLESGALSFAFYPGQLGYISKANIQALKLSCESGLNWVNGTEGGFNDPVESVKMAVTEQLGYRAGKARRFANRVTRYVTSIPSRSLQIQAVEGGYKFAAQKLGVDEFALKNFDNDLHKKEVRTLLDYSRANLDLALMAVLGCTSVYGGEKTWELIDRSIINSDQSKLNTVLKFEGLPDIPEMVRKGWQAESVVKMRLDKRVADFRNWLQSVPSGPDADVIKSYYDTFKKERVDSIGAKTLRLGIPSVVGAALSPIAGVIAKAIVEVVGVIVSGVDTFWGDRVINGWNPKVFIEKHFNRD